MIFLIEKLENFDGSLKFPFFFKENEKPSYILALKLQDYTLNRSTFGSFATN